MTGLDNKKLLPILETLIIRRDISCKICLKTSCLISNVPDPTVEACEAVSELAVDFLKCTESSVLRVALKNEGVGGGERKKKGRRGKPFREEFEEEWEEDEGVKGMEFM